VTGLDLLALLGGWRPRVSDELASILDGLCNTLTISEAFNQ
jgi:hypothetical protein